MHPTPRKAGFTLFEILIVVSLMALLAGVYLRGFGAALPFEIRSAARVLAAELQYASQRAITSGQLHRWVVDLDDQRFRVERLHEIPPPEPAPGLPTHSGLLDLRPPRIEREFEPVDNRTGEWRWLDEAVWIEEVRIGEADAAEGVIGISFAPDGGADPAELLIEDGGGHRLLLRVVAFTGEVRVEELEE